MKRSTYKCKYTTSKHHVLRVPSTFCIGKTSHHGVYIRHIWSANPKYLGMNYKVGIIHRAVVYSTRRRSFFFSFFSLKEAHQRIIYYYFRFFGE